MTMSCTTPYHPIRDGLVESMNHSPLSLLCAFAHKCSDWEDYVSAAIDVCAPHY